MTRRIFEEKSIARYLLLPLLVLMLSLSTAGAQGVIKFPSTRLTVREALRGIKEQTGYGTAYNGRAFDAGRVVILSSTDLSFAEAMQQLVTDAGFSYSLHHGVITITGSASVPLANPRKRRPATDDIYVPNTFSDISTLPRRRPLPAVAEPDTSVMVPAVDPPQPDPVSRYFPISVYASNQGAVPRWAVKTNLLYGAGTLTPNLALEIGLGRRTSLDLFASYNPWRLSGNLRSNKKLVHMIIRPELRFWTCERYNGHFIGADLIFGRYNIGSHKIPMLFKKAHRYDGIALGGGATYGYNLMVGKRWGLEFTLGAGVLWMNYDRYDCASCDRDGVKENKVYFGPTNAGISLVFLLK